MREKIYIYPPFLLENKGKAGIVLILSAELHLANSVCNCIFDGMISSFLIIHLSYLNFFAFYPYKTPFLVHYVRKCFSQINAEEKVMGKSNVKIISVDRYNGTVSAKELFAEMVAQSLRSKVGNVWTRTQSCDILKEPIVKFKSVLSFTGGKYDTSN